MRIMTIIGILLIVVGAIALLYGGISYTKEERVIDIGPLRAETQERKTIPVPPIVGGIAVASGVILIVGGRKGASIGR